MKRTLVILAALAAAVGGVVVTAPAATAADGYCSDSTGVVRGDYGILAFQRWHDVYYTGHPLQVDGVVGKATGTSMRDWAADWSSVCNGALPG